MQFERLKKSYRKQIIIGGLILVCVASAITITTTRAKYKLTENIPLVRGTINYKMPDMRVLAINISEDGTNYNIVDEIPTTGYELNSEKSVCKVATEKSGIENAPKDNNITIEYKEGKINFLGVTKHRTRCYLYFDKYVPTASEAILENITVNTGNPDFSRVATTDEGVFKIEDEMYGGYSYFWRGSVVNNYVKFANLCWRITRINGDGTIRLIYDGISCKANGLDQSKVIVLNTEAERYYSSRSYDNRSEYVGWTYENNKQRPTNPENGTPINIKIQLETWFKLNIEDLNFTEEIATGKFCNDRRTASIWVSTGNKFDYSTYIRQSTGAPSLSCLKEDIYEVKVGLITADEVTFAGGKNNINNTSFYLYSGKSYWTMSPNDWTGTKPGVYKIGINGNLSHSIVTDDNALKPVINLKASTHLKQGNGSQSNPYIVDN